MLVFSGTHGKVQDFFTVFAIIWAFFILTAEFLKERAWSAS